MKSIQEDHHKSMDLLHAQLESVDKENLRLQREVQRLASLPRTSERERTVTPTPVEIVPDFRHIERQEGEVGDFMQYEPVQRKTNNLGSDQV